ncbi:carcinoembryonic antigen-related cell adhesion molecule 21-like [Saccopteryx leptura]|uniref:carcinoembryonic antigen-related cell adhesion molecule 21-like n=1 Tax=Saccopteryx leptura TaxID=249018 RepID=UPI00339BBE58
MECPSATPRRGRVPWPGLLLAVSLLTSWSPPTTAQLAIVSVNTAEGEDVVLRLRNKPPNPAAYMWFRGEGANRNRIIGHLSMDLKFYAAGPVSTGREKINFDGTLQLKKVNLRDTGDYTVVIHLLDSKKEIGFGRLNVYQPVRVPTLLASNTTVTDNKDSVVLTCYTNALSTQWIFNGVGLQLTERMKLSPDNRMLTIDPVRMKDAGNYQCEVSNPISSVESAPVELDVKYG